MAFASVEGYAAEAFLLDTTLVVPWRGLEGLIKPHYPTGRERAEALSAWDYAAGSFPAPYGW